MARDRSLARSLSRALVLASSIGVPFGVLVSSGALAGTWLDKRWGTGPWMVLSGVVLGAVAAFVNMIQVALRFGRDSAPEGGTQGLPPAGGGSPGSSHGDDDGS